MYETGICSWYYPILGLWQCEIHGSEVACVVMMMMMMMIDAVTNTMS